MPNNTLQTHSYINLFKHVSFLIIPLNVTSLPLLSRSLVRGRGFKAHHRAVLALLVNSRSFADASSLEILDKLEAAEKVMMILLILRRYIINFIQMIAIHIPDFHERFASPHDISI